MDEVLVGTYLFQRLKQLGVDSVFGVPGGKDLLHFLLFNYCLDNLISLPYANTSLTKCF